MDANRLAPSSISSLLHLSRDVLTEQHRTGFDSHFRVTAIDETDVQRPSETRPSLKAAVTDVLRGPRLLVPRPFDHDTFSELIERNTRK